MKFHLIFSMHPRSPLVILLLCFFLIGWLYILYSWKPSYFAYKNLIWNEESRDNTLILMWTPYFGEEGGGGDPLEIMEGIPSNKSKRIKDCFKNCEITFDKTKIEEANAVVFHALDSKRSDLPEFRRFAQIWVLLEKESPVNGKNDLDPFSGVFNWTMTYRRDSDVFHPYGRIIKKIASKNYEVKMKINDFLAGKEKLVAGVISNCNTSSKREVLIEELKKEGLQIDIFGKCGVPICPRGRQADQNCSEHDFWSKLTKEYKFYLAFENSLCLDYVTEKFFRTLKLGIVPVVYGGANYSQIAPPNSFIHVESFGSSRELVNFLKNLDENNEEYRKYFEWRKRFKVVKGDGACTLCQNVKRHKLQRKKRKHHIPKFYEHLKDWWWHYPYSVKKNLVEKKIKACRNPREFHAQVVVMNVQAQHILYE